MITSLLSKSVTSPTFTSSEPPFPSCLLSSAFRATAHTPLLSSPHSHGHRPSNWTVYDYFGEFGVVVEAINNDASIPTRGNLVAPSIQGTWSLQNVYDTGFLTSYGSAVSIVAVEQYVLPLYFCCIILNFAFSCLGTPTTTAPPPSPTPASATR